MDNYLQRFLNMQEDISDEKLPSPEEMFDTFKDSITIPAYIDKGKIWDGICTVTIKIDIDQFRDWLNTNYHFGIVYVRILWYKFIDYLSNIIKYGYHFKNRTNIERFVIPDKIMEEYANNHQYNICSPAECYNFTEDDDRNAINFDILAEAYLPDEDPDAKVVTTKIIDIKNTDETIDKLQSDLDEEDHDVIKEGDDETVEDRLNKVYEEYKKTGIAKGAIGGRIIDEEINNMDNIEFIKSLDLQPVITKHIINNKKLSIKYAISKRNFIREYSLSRINDANKAWEIFCNDIVNNYDQYTNWLSYNLNNYITDNQLQISHSENNIYNVEITNSNIIRYWSDYILL